VGQFPAKRNQIHTQNGDPELAVRAAHDSNAARQQAVSLINGGVSYASIAISKTSPAFSVTRKRRKSYPSETHVKRGRRFVHGDVELIEKLGRNDLCPCGSGHRFQGMLHEIWRAYDGSNRDDYFQGVAAGNGK
jgi:hypothetical protein